MFAPYITCFNSTIGRILIYSVAIVFQIVFLFVIEVTISGHGVLLL